MGAASLILGEGPKNFRPKQLGRGGEGDLSRKLNLGGGGGLNFRGEAYEHQLRYGCCVKRYYFMFFRF